MALLGGSSEECYVCGKNVDDPVEYDGKKFCCKDCKQKYEEEQEEAEKEEVCQFC
ncbi:MAG: hypothetical protein ABEJ98_02555 [Candidatus Nanohaloarchaea archaeon]